MNELKPKRVQACPAGGPSDNESGFSIVEVLIAGALLLFISLGIIPLFTHSIGLNTEGRLSTEVSHYARSKLEELASADINAPELTIPPGQTELVTTDYLLYTHDDPSTTSVVENAWVDSSQYTAGDPWIYKRTTKVHQYRVTALDDAYLRSSEELNGSDPEVDLKRIEVTVESWGVAGVPRKLLTVQTVKVD